MDPEPFRIDVHHHILTPEYMSMLEGTDIRQRYGIQGSEDYGGFDEHALRAVYRENAVAVFPRLGSF